MPKKTTKKTFTAFHLFCGMGGGAMGFAAAEARLGDAQAFIENIGGVDCDPMAIEDYRLLTKSSGTVLDLFTIDDYIDFHEGKLPPGWVKLCGGRPRPVDDAPLRMPDGSVLLVAPGPRWREATPYDIQAAANFRTPNIVFLSPPCKSFSGLLARRRCDEAKYQALSRLVVRGLFLALEAFKDDLPEFFILENVPRIEQRGAELIERNIALLRSYGYAVQTTIHDCGEIAGGAAHRRRFILIARNTGKVQPFLYEPPLHEMRSLGDEIFKLPLPFDESAGPMHHLPKLHFKTWLRLALIPPGGDWRDLQRWAPGTFSVGRTPFNNVWQVLEACEPAPTVTSGATPTAGGPSVADPRLSDRPGRHTCKLQVNAPERPAKTVTGARLGSGTISTPDPRLSPRAGRFTDKYQVGDPERPARTVTGTMDVQAGAMSLADVRMSLPEKSVTLRVRPTDEPAATITSRSGHWDSGGQSVPDPRVAGRYHNGSYGVQDPESPSGTVSGSARECTGSFSVPDPRVAAEYRNGTLGVADSEQPGKTVVASADIWAPGESSTPDPRVGRNYYNGSYGVQDPATPGDTVTANGRVGAGPFSVPDIRVKPSLEGNYGVVDPAEPGGAVTGSAEASTGRFSLPEPRVAEVRPEFWPKKVPIILSPHTGCMHRPLTTLELMALQGFVEIAGGLEPLFSLLGRKKLATPGSRDTQAAWRGRIGNAVPPGGAKGMAETILMTLLANEAGQQPLPTTPVWVQPDRVLNYVLRQMAPERYPTALEAL